MKQSDIIAAFDQLGITMRSLGEGKEWQGLQTGVTETEYTSLQSIINKQQHLNPWFTKKNVEQALLALGEQLTAENLNNWLKEYTFSESPKRVAVIMAGNIPLVGFHDFLCVLLSGHCAVCKMSSEDNTLLPAFSKLIIQFSPELEHRIVLSKGPIGEVDAVIATGSSNSMQHFERYFGHLPHIFRKNRTSMAVLEGTETSEELHRLGRDMFDYFGLGCRNVSHLMVPADYDFSLFFDAIFDYGDIINHFKYGNNYDYNKTVYLMNLHAVLDNHFVLLYESEELFSPLAMIYYHRYSNSSEIDTYIAKHKDDLQVVIGKSYVPFGAAQCPKLDDYADGVDTLKWLAELRDDVK